MYFKKFPGILKTLYPDYLWRVETSEKEVYLTFDDGPTPEVTEAVLEMLNQVGAKATFFLLGKNIQAYPVIAHKVIDAGHSIGNHGHKHLNGWKVNNYLYFKDFLNAQRTLTEYTGYRTELFRPAYAKITSRQARKIKKTHQVVMMDVMAGDFDNKLSVDEVCDNVTQHVMPGSIICLHDSEKAWPRLSKALPRILEYLKAEGYAFKALNPTPLRSRVIR